MWHPYPRWSSCPFDPKFCSLSHLETHEHTFPHSQTQLVFLDMVIGRTTKYLKRVIVLSKIFRPNSKGVLPPIADEGNLLTKWQAYANALAQKDFNILALDNMQRTSPASFCSSFQPPHFISEFLLLWSIFLCPHQNIAQEKDHWCTLHHCLIRILWFSFSYSSPYSFSTPQKTLGLPLYASWYIPNIALSNHL